MKIRLLSALFLSLVLSSPGAVSLFKKGASDYRIIVGTNSLPSERYAAEELQRYLQKATGARLPILADSERVSRKEILLGNNTHLGKLGLKIDWPSLGQDGFVMKTAGTRLVIAGGGPRGTLNGVYTFLEEQVGVRWFTPELETVPQSSSLSLPSLDQIRVPSIEYREVFWTEMMRDADFAARHRLNGNHYQLKEKHGGRFAVYHPFVHSFDLLIPPELYQEHPEYFPLINGERKKGYVQRCLSNPDVLKLSIQRVRQWIKEHPEASIISVSQNDTGNWCQCQSCKALDDREGTPAASLIQFVNAIAANIEQDHPNVRIDTLAYQYTRKPPAHLRPRKNVIIRLCSIECCFAHPLATCASQENRRFVEDIVAWQPVASTLYIWDYTPNFANYQQPFPNFAALQPNVKFFVEHGVKGLFEQGNYSSGGGGEMGPLRAYLLAKLLWEPGTDLSRHRSEFLAAYYGPAASRIASYLDLLESQVAAANRHAHIFDSSKAGYLSAEFTTKADQVLEQAEQATNDETIRFRVQTARLPVWYVQMATDRVTGEQKAALLRRFLEIARKARISHISESQSLDAWARKMGAE